jgi:hypothetical protein
MQKREILRYIEKKIDEGFFGEIILPMQNGKVEVIKVKESLKEIDVQKRLEK